MARKERADHLVHSQGLADSREQAKRFIMAGEVYYWQGDTRARVDKPGHAYPCETVFEVEGKNPYASRGAYKLLTALECFSLDVSGLVCLV